MIKASRTGEPHDGASDGCCYRFHPIFALLASLLPGCGADRPSTDVEALPTVREIQLSQADRADVFTTRVPRAGKALGLRGAPRYIAAVAHGLDSARVSITELGTGRTMVLPATEAEPHEPRWVPDGGGVVFRAGSELLYYVAREQRLRQVATGLPDGGSTPYAFSPNGRLLAIARSAAIQVVPFASNPTAGLSWLELPKGLSFEQMLWTPDNRSLVVLCRNELGETSVVWIDTATYGLNARPGANLTALLGWDASGALIVASGSDERIGDAAAALLPSGEIRGLRNGPETDSGEFVLAHRADTRQTVVMLGTEDPGDPTALLVLPSDASAGRPWLRSFPKLDQLALSRDGRWAVFIDRIAGGATAYSGGNVYVVPFGSDDARLALEANAEVYAFTDPTLGP